MKKVIFSPAKYIQGEHELENLYNYSSTLAEKGAYAIVDPFILDNYQSQISQGFKGRDFNLVLERFMGECSKNEVNRIVDAVKKTETDIIIAIGGGKTIDTAKAVAYYLKLAIIVVPTIAATDAPCSALSVLYTDDGEFDEYLLLRSNPNMVVVDTSVISKAPARLLVAGIGDAMSTYYEARACYRSNAITMANGHPSLAAMSLAKLCLDTLFADGLKAKLSVESKTVSKALDNVIEANTYLSGVGFESGGLAAAHAIHNGMTVLEEAHNMYHGEKVAFGVLVQLVLENESLSEIEKVIKFSKSLNLPTTLAEFNIDRKQKDRIMMFAEASVAEGETIHNMPFKVTANDVYAAILLADDLAKRF